MTLPAHTGPRTPLRLAARRWLLMTFAAVLLFGCGGGGGDGGVGSGGTGSFASGSVTGLGSVIVNAVRFDDSTARIEDADGNLKSRDDVRLGMSVEIDAGAIVPATATALATSTASRIRYASEMVGAIQSIDRAAGTLTVLGQLISVSAQTTVFDASLSGGLDALAVGRVIEVHGQFDATVPRYRATRIEPAAAGATPRLRGPVTQLDTAAKTFRIGGATFAYGQASGTPTGLAVGSFVRVALQVGTDSAGRWVVTSFKVGVSTLPDAEEATVKGLITSFSSITSFSVNGQPVTTGSATEFKDGSAGLAVGVRVEVEGSVSGGVLRAGKVAIESDDEEQAREYEFDGAITSVNSAGGTFVVLAGGREVTIGTSRPDLEFDNGTAADLKAGAKVEVKGLLAAGGTVVEATRIKFDD